ncbi:MAG: hypothetical protein GC164_02455 [Phycisphaera sp.]|nr:hypothetical protein [Phycisphaera sp.]
MKNALKMTLVGATMGLASAGAYAANVAVVADITESTTWTASNTYNLVGQIYVSNGATLTIEAGTRIASDPGDEGALAITRGSKIMALGTKAAPIVFTSTNDTGSQRYAVNEWGNVTIMGKGLIGHQYIANGSGIDNVQDGTSASPYANTAVPSGLNKAAMEGLLASPAGDPRVIYGGTNDNDDSGTLQYVSLRFGGSVATVEYELNGLSMGGIGRETDVNHIDIFSNIDDGIETWGGTVNYKYISIWNIGDDSFDVDQGWRGKAQFICIVQGYGATAKQGSGAGDNAFEIDGAEANNAVPHTCATIYNATVIGQPDGQNGGAGAGSDHVFTYRDNAHVQYRNILVLNGGAELVREESSENGFTDLWRYGQGTVAPFNTTPAFTNAANGVWGLRYTAEWDTTNSLTGGNASCTNYLGSGVAMSVAELKTMYQSQSAGDGTIGQGYLCEVTDSLFYNNRAGSAYTKSDSVGVTSSGATNAGKANVVRSGQTSRYGDSSDLPINVLTYGTVFVNTDTVMANVVHFDPRINTTRDAQTVSHSAAPSDGFFSQAMYRGAFSANCNWLVGWTAASQFGLLDTTTYGANVPDPNANIYLTSTITFDTEPGCDYVIEYNTGSGWNTLTTISGDGNTQTYTDTSALVAGKIYRVTPM